MYQSFKEAFPEVEWIQDEMLRSQVEMVYREALKMGNWELEDVDVLPFTLVIPDTIISYRTHVRAVTRMSYQAYQEAKGLYEEKYALNFDYLIAGALLHDVGKIIEYTKNEDGKFVKSYIGKNLRHPFSGAGLAMKFDLPCEVAHIIANHAHEGNGTLRSPEGVVIYHADMLNFEMLKSFVGMI